MDHLESGTPRERNHLFGHSLRFHATCIAATLLFALLASSASAQYFGRNKVKYRAFDFQVMKTEHFDIYFYPTEREGVDIAARLAERWYTRLERLFDHGLSDRQPLILYASHSDFEQTNVITGELSEGTGGVTESQRRRIVLPLTGSIRDSDHVIGHELVHAFQFDMARLIGQAQFARLPEWFVEGMAEYVSLGRIDANAAMKVRDAVRRDELPSILDLDKSKYFPYQWGHAVFAYIASRYGERAVPRLLRGGLTFGNVEDAIKTALGVSAQALSSDWHVAIRQLYDPVLSASVALPDADRLAVKGRRIDEALDFAPSLSPDNRWLAFLSTRSRLSIDLYVGDTKTGRIMRRLTRMSTDPHYTSIQFINSSGTWDPSSEFFAIGTIVAGRPAISIFNVRTGRRERDIVLSGIDEIRSPSWAPDGHAIAFTGMRRGLTDLYVYELKAETVRQLTSDAYADLQSAWSPDSRRIAFATDRFSSDLDSLHMGALRLAIADAATGTLEAVPVFDKGKHINPQWGRDGQSLYFIADPDGVPNVYHHSLVSGETKQMTAVGTGVSGITPSGPALSVSADNGRLAVSVYENEGYHIYLWSATAATDPPRTLPRDAAALSPIDRSSLGDLAVSAAADPRLPQTQTYPSTPYKATMSLLGAGQSAAGVGLGSFGATAGGGASFAFGDMLNDRLLAAAVQVGTPLSGVFNVNDIAFDTGYVRQDHRWKWGFIGKQTPYLTGTFESGPATTVNGEQLADHRQTIVRETRRSGSGVLFYPFDRARRLELTGGLAQASRERIVTSTVYSVATDELVSSNTETHLLGQRLDLATSAAAFVFDTTTFGPTSPIHGQRHRLEVAPTFGSIRFTGVLQDHRWYMMPVPFYTIAARVIHYGRYGADADDARLYPIYLNDPSLVRGYSTLDLFSTGCLVTSTDVCEAADRITGSRILVGNLEFRFPLLRPFGAWRGMYGPVPVELAVFGDTGVAWSRGGKPSLPGGSRPGISSVGVAVRIALGFAAAEFDVVRPFQRLDRGWTLGFNLMPGW
jgi:Tol biopolymer transport system component